MVETKSKNHPLWRDLVSLQLALVGSVAGCYAGSYLFFMIWDRGPFVPGIVGLCAGICVLILTRRGGISVALVAMIAALLMQLSLNYETRPYGFGTFGQFVIKLMHNITPRLFLDHAIGLVLAGALAGLLPRMWKRK